MQSWLVILLFVLGFLFILGLFRASYRRYEYGWDLGDFFLELLYIDMMSGIFSGSSEGFFDSFDGFGDGGGGGFDFD